MIRRNLAQHDLHRTYNSGPTMFAHKDSLLASILKEIMITHGIPMGFSTQFFHIIVTQIIKSS